MLKKWIVLIISILAIIAIIYLAISNITFVNEDMLNQELNNSQNSSEENNNNNTSKLSIYLINPETMQPIKTSKAIGLNSLTNDLHIVLINELSNSSNGYLAPIPNNCKILSSSIEDGILTLDLSTEFINQDTSNGKDKLILECITRTLTNLLEIQKIRFTIEGDSNCFLGQYNLSSLFSKSSFQ